MGANDRKTATDAMLDAAVRKAVELGLICPPGWPDGGKRDRGLIEQIVTVAIEAEESEVPA